MFRTKSARFKNELKPLLSYKPLKVPVFPFHKFPTFTPKLGPEMRSIGEIMVQADSLNELYAKGYIAAGYKFNLNGKILICTHPEYLETLNQQIPFINEFKDKFIFLSKKAQ